MQVTIPSMASVFNEYALKSQYDTSIYLQVITLQVVLAYKEYLSPFLLASILPPLVTYVGPLHKPPSL